MMNTYDPQHLLLCEKEDLVLYIQELRDDYDRNAKEHKWVYVKHMNDITRLEKENKQLKEENDEVWEQASKVTGEKLKLHSEIEKLQEENKQLKEQLEDEEIYE